MGLDVSETGFYDALDCLVIQLDRHAHIRFMNRFTLALLGYESLAQIAEKPLNTVLPDDETQNGKLLRVIKSLPAPGSAKPC